MRHAAWVLGYHGCDRETGEAILSGKQDILSSTNDYDWLGTGAYFWENSYSRALAWAEFLKANPGISKKPVTTPSVVGAIIDPGNCLDLTEADCLDVLKAAQRQFKLVWSMLNIRLPKNEPGYTGDEDLIKRKLDCAVVNYLHQVRRSQKPKKIEFDTVRAPFMEGGPLYSGSKFTSRTHVQWCVRQPRTNVFAYFRPRVPAPA